MKRTVVAILLSMLSACVSAPEATVQSRFLRERSALACYEGSTSEPSCGGTVVAVYLDGDQVRHLDWTVETSTQFIRRQYFFDGGSPRVVKETIHKKLDADAEPLAKPRLLSSQEYTLDAARPIARQNEFLDHARFLADEFRKRRKDFSRATRRTG